MTCVSSPDEGGEETQRVMRLVGHVLEKLWLAIVSLATLASASAGVEVVGRSTLVEERTCGLSLGERHSHQGQAPASYLCQAFAPELFKLPLSLHLLLHPKCVFLLKPRL